MNKAELVNWIANKTGLTKKDVDLTLSAFVDAVMETVKSGDSVTLTNFGTFMPLQRKASEKRNPKTGEKVKVPARKVPKFKPGKQFRDALN
ncbi:HU family DNA-binding protein [Candidatus Dojkabacteria bacterium]|uniref:HU family DNA-binding protein n=1 Tax=Candidatus Dojkabacteria bacterium TaxID=2099670 RepID=A0A3M0Z5A9_9BACT|nr:MAG: HU family DNA-binding protein [Candidatus Dojkabacteria bacterium]